jgi:hypothetical protein
MRKFLRTAAATLLFALGIPYGPSQSHAAPADPQRFLKVKEWRGVLTTKAESSGQQKDTYSSTTWSSAISVSGRFQLKPHHDSRNLDSLSWRGKGEAVIRVTGKRFTQFPRRLSPKRSWVTTRTPSR